ncbi:unnamed protein product [Paramecium sonneborni]|uniref:Transmembrane protein n=1 Tax=Paramecium sonneborni TaxID=65129 RepID=A0A8S1QQW3_9CILI|nr:unnamed protein product [Paramecium sonneborni]
MQTILVLFSSFNLTTNYLIEYHNVCLSIYSLLLNIEICIYLINFIIFLPFFQFSSKAFILIYNLWFKYFLNTIQFFLFLLLYSQHNLFFKFNNFISSIEHIKILLNTFYILVYYGQKIVLINLENDVIKTQCKINQQEPLIVKLNNLSKDYFSVLWKEGLLKIFKLGNSLEPLLFIEIGTYENYELFYMYKKTTILFSNQDSIIRYVYEKELINNMKQRQIIYTLYYKEKDQRLYMITQVILNQNRQAILKIKNLNPYTNKNDYQNLMNCYNQNKLNKIKISSIQMLLQLLSMIQHILITKKKLSQKRLQKIKYGIAESVNTLQLEQLQELQHFIVDKLINYLEQTKTIQIGQKLQQEEELEISLNNIIFQKKEQSQLIHKLETICSKIQFNRLTQKPKQDKNYRKQEHTIYEEQQADILITQGNLSQKQINENNNYGEDQTNQIEDDFNQVYIKHKQTLIQRYRRGRI